jgi:hypothetical protein
VESACQPSSRQAIFGASSAIGTVGSGRRSPSSWRYRENGHELRRGRRARLPVSALGARWADDVRAEDASERPRVDPADQSWMHDNPDEMPAPIDRRLFDMADDLRGAAHTAPEPVIEGLLLLGLTLLHGPAKKGKSWLLVQMLLAVERGERFLDRKVRRGTALYIGCEDTRVRFKSRLQRMFGDGTLRMMSREQLELFASRYVDEEGTRRHVTIEQILVDLWNATGRPDVIAIDTQEVFEAVLGIVHGKTGDSITRRDYLATSAYDRVAHKLGISIVTVGHWGELKSVEKATHNPHECINTTKARLAGVSTSITLGPLPNQELGESHRAMQLSIRGRDVANGDQFLWVEQDADTGCFRYVGNVRDVQLTDAQARLYTALYEARKDHGPEHWTTAADLAEDLDCSPQAVKQMVGRVRRAAKGQGREPMFQGCVLESKPKLGYRLR